MVETYWSRLTRSRVSRRKALATSATAAAAFSLLQACGGGKSQSGGGASSTGLLTVPSDTTKQAKAGGTFRSFITADAPTLSPETGAGSSRVVTWRCYSRLTGYPPSYLEKAYVPGEPAPELAESWEISPDKLQITFKLNPQAKWDSRAPTNSRQVDAQDIIFSWDKFLALNANRNNLANSLNPTAPVSSVQAVDSRTVVVKTAFPSVDVFDAMAVRFFMMPRELDGGFDARSSVRGASPWILSEYQPSVGFTFQKNPNWIRKDPPFIDKVEVPIIPEYAQRLAQFRAGSIHWADIRDEDILPTKRDLPDLALYQEDFSDSAVEVRFGLASADSPFWDVRVRRAVSMLIDRDLYARTFSAIDAYKKEGIEVETRWANIAGFKQAIEPRDKDFGPASTYYKYNVAEAKKLLVAAGFPNGMLEIADPRWASIAERLACPGEVEALVSSWTRDRGSDEACAALVARGVAAAKVQRTDEVLNDIHMAALNWFKTATHPDMGTHRHNGFNWRFARTPCVVRSASPRLGEHSALLLRTELGLSDAEVRGLFETGISGYVFERTAQEMA